MNKTEKTLARTERMNIRLTRDEINMIIEKSKKCFHGNKTRFLIEAASSYNEKGKVKNYDNIRKYSDILNGIQTELSRQGNNLNQIAHSLNSIVKSGGTVKDNNEVGRYVHDVLQPFLNEFSDHMKDFNKRSSGILNKMIKSG